MPPRLILGLGTGFCGTGSLTEVLNRQPDHRVSAGELPVVPWSLPDASTSYSFATTVSGVANGQAVETGSLNEVGRVSAFYGSSEELTALGNVGVPYAASGSRTWTEHGRATYARSFDYGAASGWTQASVKATGGGEKSWTWTASYHASSGDGSGSGDCEDGWSGSASGRLSYSAYGSGAKAITSAILVSSASADGSLSYSSWQVWPEGNPAIREEESGDNYFSYRRGWGAATGSNTSWGTDSTRRTENGNVASSSANSYNVPGGGLGLGPPRPREWYAESLAEATFNEAQAPYLVMSFQESDLLPPLDIGIGPAEWSANVDLGGGGQTAQTQPLPPAGENGSPASQSTSVGSGGQTTSTTPSFTYDAQGDLPRPSPVGRLIGCAVDSVIAHVMAAASKQALARQREAQLSHLMNAATAAIAKAAREIDALYAKLLTDPSGNLSKARVHLSPEDSTLLGNIERFFATPLAATSPSGRLAGFIDWENLAAVVETITSMATGCTLRPCSTEIVGFGQRPHTAAENGENIAKVSHGFIARVWGIEGTIYIYDRFWDLPPSRQAAYLIHEFSHVYGGTLDVAYLAGPAYAGYSPHAELGRYLDSSRAVRNADNYRVFFEQIYLGLLRLPSS